MANVMRQGYRQVKRGERLELALLRRRGYGVREIARVLGRNPATISRELRRNATVERYEPRWAQAKARLRRRFSKFQGMKVRLRPELERSVIEGLQQGWSPEQIAGRLRLESGRTVVSYRVIYKWLYSSWGQRYCCYLPLQRWRPRRRRPVSGGKLKKLGLRPMLSERPVIVARRERLGDWEGDTLGAPRRSRGRIVGLVDRRSRFLALRKVRRPRLVVEGLGLMLRRLPVETLTLDNAVEHARWRQLKVPTYFCQPYRAWEKPGIENSFQRLRRWLPKGTRTEDVSPVQLERIVRKMNGTPRRCLGWRTPEEVFNQGRIKMRCCA